MRKLICVLLAAVLALGLASCGYVGQSVSLNSDGSGVITVQAGLTEEGLTLLDESGEEYSGLAKESMIPFTKNGVTYYGTVERHSFASLQEMAELLSSTGDGPVKWDAAGLSITQNSDGTFTLTVGGAEEEPVQEAQEPVDPELAAMMAEMVAEVKFTFPTPVVQTSGSTQGVTISSNTVTLDITKLATQCSFSSGFNSWFSDVASGSWYYTPISALAHGGLVVGVDEGTFRPLATITYSQFCQIVANAKGLAVGSANGYWAYGAINSCVQAGIIASRGEITPANYDVPITREVAVDGLMKAIPKEMLKETNAQPSIPDLNSVAAQYQNSVRDAYRYGVVSGTGDGSFAPKNTLTRAEFCQLLYQVGWVKAS